MGIVITSKFFMIFMQAFRFAIFIDIYLIDISSLWGRDHH